jgi:hypothetical protein
MKVLAIGGFMLTVARAFSLVVALVAVDAAAQDGATPAQDKKAAGKGDYSLDTSKTSSSAAVKSDAVFSIVIVPASGLKIHPQAPLEVKLKTTEGLKPAKAKLGRADVKDAAALAPELSTTVNAAAAGKQEIEASVSFFLCSDSWCQRMTDKVVVPVNVTN